jgi:transcriptional regulator with XRE-family HTH domain
MSKQMTSPETLQLRELRKTIGRNIHELRIARKMRLGELSRKTGISPEQLDAFEIGKYDITLQHMVRIASALESEAIRLVESSADSY